MMRGRLTVAATALVVGSALAAAPPGDVVLDDWLIAEVVVEADPGSADADAEQGPAVDFAWEVELDWVGSEDGQPRYEGSGISQADLFNFLTAYPRLAGDTHAQLVTPVEGQEVELVYGGEGGGTSMHSYGVRSLASGRWFLVVMGSGMRLNRVAHAEPVVTRGTLLHFEVHRGHGTRAVRNLDPDAVGAGVGSGPTATGAVVHRRDAPDGIYGGLLFNRCGTCQATWLAPDGRSGDVTSVQTPLHGTMSGSAFTFAGTAGTWQWSWAGHRTPDAFDGMAPNDAVFAMYAPIGDLHLAFDLIEGEEPATRR